MIFTPPNLTQRDQKVIDEITADRDRLRYVLSSPRRWLGLLRRSALARAIRGSNTIEGYDVSQEDALAIIEGEEPLDATKESALAVKGYRDAMTYVLQSATDSSFSYSDSLIKSLHFMMIQHDLSKHPGRWRPGEVFVHDDVKQQVVYEGPDADRVALLIAELMNYLNEPTACPPFVRAAMAHLNLVMIHPFKDGNGRMARCLQTLVLGREGILEPQFSSIEEYLGKNTLEYYDVLAEVGQGKWNPQNDATPWMQFCLVAHYKQAKTLIRREEQLSAAWKKLMELANQYRLPERAVFALLDATFGHEVRNATYRPVANIPEYLASRDLKNLVELGLLIPVGERRGRVYKRSEILAQIRKEVALSKEIEHPYKKDDQLLLSPAI